MEKYLNGAIEFIGCIVYGVGLVAILLSAQVICRCVVLWLIPADFLLLAPMTLARIAVGDHSDPESWSLRRRFEDWCEDVLEPFLFQGV